MGRLVIFADESIVVVSHDIFVACIFVSAGIIMGELLASYDAERGNMEYGISCVKRMPLSKV